MTRPNHACSSRRRKGTMWKYRLLRSLGPKESLRFHSACIFDSPDFLFTGKQRQNKSANSYLRPTERDLRFLGSSIFTCCSPSRSCITQKPLSVPNLVCVSVILQYGTQAQDLTLNPSLGGKIYAYTSPSPHIPPLISADPVPPRQGSWRGAFSPVTEQSGSSPCRGAE